MINFYELCNLELTQQHLRPILYELEQWLEGEIRTPYHADETTRNIIKRNPQLAALFAIDVIQSRWHEAEPYILNDTEWAMYYAKNVIKGRWPEAEPNILRTPLHSYQYAKNVIKGRWPEGEGIIKTDDYARYSYAKDVIKGRWLEAEYLMRTDTFYWGLYQDVVIDKIYDTY